MTVIDSEGNIVGTVKDVGFTVGKAGISLSVEDKDGDIRDVAWDSIQGAGDFVLLKPSAFQPAVVMQPVQAAQPAQQTQQAQPNCPTCGRPLTYVQQYQRWYCYNEKKYV